MNDLTPQERDELASAYLDGEATAAEQAMVEADSDLLARVEQLRHAAEEVASPVAEAGREEIIAQALKAFKPETEKARETPRLGILPRLKDKLSIGDRLRNRQLVPIFGVAAALVVVFLAISIFALTSEDTSDDFDAASSAMTTESAQILESAELQADEALADTAPAFAPATTAAQAADFAPTTSAAPATTAVSPAVAPSGEGRPFTEIEQDDMRDGAEAQQAAGPPQEARAQLAEPDGGLDAECPEDEPAEEEPSISEPDDAQNSLDPDTSPETSLNPSSTTSSLPPEEASGEDSSDLNTDIFEDAPLAECP